MTPANFEGVKEAARQYAETKMPENWDRHDEIQISIFYNHMIDFIGTRYLLVPKISVTPATFQ